MVLHIAYAKLRRFGLVTSHSSFSSDYMNKGARYYDHLICSRKPPAIAALLSLFVRLRAISEAFAATPSLTTQASELSALSSAIWEEMERRSCALLPANRSRPSPTKVIQGKRASWGS
jgi:hypothetical protein